LTVNLVTLFAICVFSLAWFFWSRTPDVEPLGRLFFGTLMFLGAMVGFLDFFLRAYLAASLPTGQ
jgi:hypothetical protein